MNKLLRKAAGPKQMLPVHTLIEYCHSQGIAHLIVKGGGAFSLMVDKTKRQQFI